MAQQPPRPWARADWIALAGVTFFAAAVRLFGIGHPEQIVFDEYYYAREACWYLYHAPTLCGVPAVVVHPQLAKWLIALGIKVFGFTPFGWRIASAVAGTVTVLALYLLGRRTLRTTLGASLAAGLLAVDFLHFLLSRVAMLDSFVGLFSLLTILFCHYDRDATDVTGRGLMGRPWRIAAGVAAGAAIASKWPGAFALLTGLTLTLAWDVSARPASDRRAAVGQALRAQALSVGVWLVVLPAVIYVASFAGTVSGLVLASPWAEGSWVRAFMAQQRIMAEAHSTFFKSIQAYSPPWLWILGREPVIFYFDFGESTISTIVALGNPFVWWLSIAALIYAGVRVVRSRDLRSSAALIVTGFTFAYLPWFVIGRARGLYLWHFLPAVPFACLAVADAVGQIGRPDRRARFATAVAAGSLIFFVYVYPILTATPVPESSTRLFGSPMHNCDLHTIMRIPWHFKPRPC